MSPMLLRKKLLSPINISILSLLKHFFLFNVYYMITRIVLKLNNYELVYWFILLLLYIFTTVHS